MLKQQINQYTGITKYYDLLMTAGYYDYDAQTDALADILKPSNSVLEFCRTLRSVFYYQIVR